MTWIWEANLREESRQGGERSDSSSLDCVPETPIVQQVRDPTHVREGI